MIQPLTKAFKELRTLGYLAERRLGDCRSCAMCEIPEDKDNLHVYTTDQTEDNFKKIGSGYLMWSAPEDNAKEIVKILKKNGVKASWNGKPTIGIKVIM